jgi:prepilin-type N-terminal cleavage/methylation domain-containing protein
MMIITKPNDKGFTLIEAMICLFVISIGLLAVTRMQVASIDGNVDAMNRMNSVMQARNSSDMMISYNFNNNVLLDGTSNSVVPNTNTSLTSTTHADNGSGYTTTYTVSDVRISSDNTLKMITMTTRPSGAPINAPNAYQITFPVLEN